MRSGLPAASEDYYGVPGSRGAPRIENPSTKGVQVASTRMIVYPVWAPAPPPEKMGQGWVPGGSNTTFGYGWSPRVCSDFWLQAAAIAS